MRNRHVTPLDGPLFKLEDEHRTVIGFLTMPARHAAVLAEEGRVQFALNDCSPSWLMVDGPERPVSGFVYHAAITRGTGYAMDVVRLYGVAAEDLNKWQGFGFMPNLAYFRQAFATLGTPAVDRGQDHVSHP